MKTRMNRGAHDDPADYGEVPGHGPTVILAHLDGDELSVPDTIEDRLRREREDAWLQAKAECGMSQVGYAKWQRDGSLDRDWRPDDLPELPPPRSADDYGTDDGDECVDDTPPVMAPIYTALLVAVCVQVLVTVLLVALRVGGALDWGWGWVLAPLWVPSTVATVLVAVICLWLAAIDERDSAHRRNLKKGSLTMSETDTTTARWDPERSELVVTACGRVMHVVDEALDTWRFDLDHLPAEFTGTFRGPEFEGVRDALRPGYEAAQAAHTALRWSAIGAAIHDLTGLSTNDGDEGVFEADLAKRGYRIVREAPRG